MTTILRIIPIALAGLLLVLGSVSAYAEGYAIIVGVNDCPNFRLPDGSRPRPLRGAENDADAIAGLLVNDYGFQKQHILVLKGKAATAGGVKAAFEKITAMMGKDDLFVFHFSGHGTQIADRRPLDEPDRLDEALCTFDATEQGQNLILDDQLGLWLDAMEAGEVTVILDCCHAGTGTKDPNDEVVARYLPIRGSKRRADAVKKPWRELAGSTKSIGRRMTAFFACRPEQQSYERRMLQFKPPRRAGQFTTFVVEGLSGATADLDRDGRVSNQELAAYATRRLDERFNRDRTLPAEQQRPLVETDQPDAPVFGILIEG